ncbi:MAG: DUF3303 domain-containing protein [Candidatus Acidiferrales bacterium]
MLFMVIERFKQGNPKQVGERFQSKGRLLPKGVLYHTSWMDLAGERCFQLMEAPDRESLNAWISCWEDLVDFEIVPVVASSDFWSKNQVE